MVSTVEAWEFDPSCDLEEVVRIARERLTAPTLSGHLLSTRGDALTVQVVDGAPSGDREALLYVAGHGAFLIGRREVWPARAPGGRDRLLLTLLAFPPPRAAIAPARER